MKIRKRTWKTKSGIRVGWIVDYYDAEGQRQRRQFETRGEAKLWGRRVEAEMEAGTHTPDSKTATVGEASQLWLRRAETEGLEQSTKRQYQTHVDLHICPIDDEGFAVDGFTVNGVKLAEIKLSRLTKPQIEKFRDYLLTRNSRATARKILVSFKSILNEAKRQGLIARNPADEIVIKEDTRNKPLLTEGQDFPSRQEVRAVISTVSDLWLRAFIVVAVFAGMRASELRGLSWPDVDYDRRIIRVRQRASQWGELGPPKSKAGRRDIPMDDLVAEALKEWEAVCPAGEHKLVFPNGVGNIESHGNIMNRGWYPLQVASGVSRPLLDDEDKPIFDKDGNAVMDAKYDLHSLRHFCASVWIEQGFSAKRLQTMLGHATITVTFDLYGHMLDRAEDDRAKMAAGRAWVLGENRAAVA
jgi:integrase